MFWCFLELWHAIPDYYGPKISKAKPAEKGECILLLATKYKPDLVKKLTEIMTSQNGDFRSMFAKSAILVTSLWATGESYPLPVFFPIGYQQNCSICCGDLFGNAYFRFGEQSKIVRICTFFALFVGANG